MERDLVRDYLEKSGMNQQQADALSRVLDQMAARSDLLLLEEKMEGRFLGLEKKIEAVKGELTWRMFAAVALLAMLMTLLDVFVE